MKLRSSNYAQALDGPSAIDLLRKGLSHHQEGRPGKAAELYRRALEVEGNLPDGYHLLGAALIELGSVVEAIPNLERAVRLRPQDPHFWVTLGNAHLMVGDAAKSIAFYDKAIEIEPTNADFHYNRANVYARAEAHEIAIQGYLQALQLNDGHCGAHFNLANSFMAIEQEDAALAHYHAVLQLAPQYPNLWKNIGICLVRLKQLDQAEMALRMALEQSPSDPQAHGNLGALLSELDRFDESIDSYSRALQLDPSEITCRLNLARTLQKARHPRAVQVAEEATELAPDLAEAWVTLGDARLEFGLNNEILFAYEKALALDPDCMRDSNNLGLAYYNAGRLDEAVAFYEEALSRRPEDADAWGDLGVTLLHRGEVAQAIANLQRSIGLNPANEVAHSTLLISECYSAQHSGLDIREEAERWAQRFTPTGSEFPPVHVAPKEKLRIGYLSADFHRHPAGNLYAALFPHHDRDRFELVAYSTNQFQDEVTEKIIASCDEFGLVARMPNHDLAKLVRSHEIDILIDLLGHTPGHRLKAFGMRPAPIQATWLGYFGTTGMSQMDYILCDRVVLPEAHESHFTERPARMPNCMYAYQPPQIPVEPGELPLLHEGTVTFGCFNNLSKIHEGVVALWAQVMHAVPGSRMVLNRWPLDSAAVRETYWGWFEKFGIDRDRVELRHTKGQEAYFRSYQDVDLMLDSFPFGGGTTTSDALWMGVPVVSLSGDRFVGRMTETILRTVGVPELLPEDERDFVRMAVDLVNDSARLANYRQRLRVQLVGSPMCDIAQFSRDLEATYEWMWAQKCAG